MENISCFNAFLILPYTRQTQTPTQQNAAERETTNIIAKSESRKAFTYLSFRLVRRIPFSNRKNLFFFGLLFLQLDFPKKCRPTPSADSLLHTTTHAAGGKLLNVLDAFPLDRREKLEKIYFPSLSLRCFSTHEHFLLCIVSATFCTKRKMIFPNFPNFLLSCSKLCNNTILFSFLHAYQILITKTFILCFQFTKIFLTTRQERMKRNEQFSLLSGLLSKDTRK